jgi:quinol monooxygenase YgiN
MDPTGEVQIIWQFSVKADCREVFELAYAPQGKWVQLFKKCPGFIKTDLMRDTRDSQVFLTIDHWRSLAAYAEMKQVIGSEYSLLDRECAAYTLSERLLGIFAPLD